MTINWSKLIEIFGTDDGSLPDIELKNLSGEEVIKGYEFVRNHSGRISSDAPFYWSNSKDCEVRFSYEDNPSVLVVSGEAQSFHLCFEEIKSPSGKRIPELGLYVFLDRLCFDYRMGPHWDEEAIEGLFELIYSMSKKYKCMSIFHKTNMNDDGGKVFKSYWDEYQQKLGSRKSK